MSTWVVWNFNRPVSNKLVTVNRTALLLNVRYPFLCDVCMINLYWLKPPYGAPQSWSLVWLRGYRRAWSPNIYVTQCPNFIFDCINVWGMSEIKILGSASYFCLIIALYDVAEWVLFWLPVSIYKAIKRECVEENPSISLSLLPLRPMHALLSIWLTAFYASLR